MAICPICFRPIGTWHNDPILTPDGIAGPSFVGFTRILADHIKEIQDDRKAKETELGLTPTEFSPVNIINFFQNWISYITELRESTDKILDELGLTYDDYFNYDEEGTDMRPGNHQENWNDPNLEANHFQCKAIHIEDLRHYIELEQYFFKETWETNKEIISSDSWNDSVAVSCNEIPDSQSKNHQSIFNFFYADYYWYGGIFTSQSPICNSNIAASGQYRGIYKPIGSGFAQINDNFIRNDKINYSTYCNCGINVTSGNFYASSTQSSTFTARTWLHVPKHFKFKITGINIANLNRSAPPLYLGTGADMIVRVGFKIYSFGPSNEHFAYLLLWDENNYINNLGSSIYISNTMTNISSASTYLCLIQIEINISSHCSNQWSPMEIGQSALCEIEGLTIDKILLIDAD